MTDKEMNAIVEAERCIDDGELWPYDRALDALKEGGIIERWWQPSDEFAVSMTPGQISRLLEMLREWAS